MRCLWMAVLVCVVALSATSTVQAQTQIKPYFMVIFDDSGSMSNSTGGGNNSCGESHTRLNDAKCALQRVVSGFGDVTFGLTSFKEYGTGTTIHVPIFEDNQTDILSWVDFGGSPELVAGDVTPIRDALDNVRAYYQSAAGPVQGDPARGCRPYFVILLHDGNPCCNTRNNLSNSVAAAGRLLNTPISGGANERIETHVIYFGTSSTSLGQANQIAAGGGTVAAQQATNEEQLALAFSNIVADSLLTEVCDNADNDCDSLIDEGFQKYCDLESGVTGTTLCVNPGDPCDDEDDNCFDGTDDEVTNLCGTCGTPPAEVCDGLDNNCNSIIDEGGVCMGCIPTGAEICDNVDNDCDTRIDEDITRPCGTDVGECRAGTETCVLGAFGACTGTGPSPEVCNGLDDDCDGVTDGLTRPCGSDVGTCVPGTELCTAGSFGTCTGTVGPTTERCDGFDNDCDGSVDESDSMLGDGCGDGTGACMPGTIACVAGALTCTGGVGPTAEVCNGIDDDCDGVIDDGLGVGDPCGSDVGICTPGVNVCRGGSIVCEGAVGAVDEVCNSLDDDCDGVTDEALPLGAACGTDEGLCMAGTQQCIDGRDVCTGEVPPSAETCDCEDNDCDGTVDEAGTASLCPGESACVDCQCALPCQATEFGFVCPTGKAPSVTDGVCHCVAELCNAVECAGFTRTRDDELLCASGSDEVADCVCKNNVCTFACDGVVCTDGTVCNPRDPAGRCVEDSCRGLGCPAGELCDTATGACEADPCVDVTCADGEACRAGECIGSCADVSCGASERCVAGACVPDLCDGVSCGGGEACDPADGSCVPDLCTGVRCPTEAVCDPVTGECEADPCLGLTCPAGQTCELGECIGGGDTPDAGTDAGGTPDAGPTDGRRVLATGSGGCTCTVAPGVSAPGASTPWGLGLLVGLLGLALARRRTCPRTHEGSETSTGSSTTRTRRRSSLARLAALLGSSAVLLVGCDVDPFCLDCADTPPADGAVDTGTVDTGAADGGVEDSAVEDSAVEDSMVVFDGCTPGATELCNEEDDDCDGMVDEGVDIVTSLENCGGCGMLCAPAGAFGLCELGRCGIDSCDVGFFDLDGVVANGCEYRCLPTSDDDSICDFSDNDCDGEVDEDFDLDTDALNCGSCGRTCSFPHAVASCSGAACVLGDCAAGFHDINGVQEDGCEYSCTAADPAVEVCNLVDDDCDGMVDEGDPGGGGSCGTDVGACVAGTESCVAGTIACMGSVTTTTELCNSIDDDCDGSTDEGFLSDDINNCGSCGNVCAFTNAVAACVSSTCEMTCLSGFVDLDGIQSTGCEYPCTFTGPEVCNGRDDDCDGTVDIGISPPPTFCNANGVCAGTTARCDPATGWTCDYPGTFEATEVSCDNLDNDCNGVADDPFLGAGLHTVCSNGTGSCQRFGTIECAPGGATVACNAPVAGAAGTEVCDGLDNDCDGAVDEPRASPGTNPSYVVDEMVRIRSNLYVYTFEASRPDATSTEGGAAVTRSCSRPNVMPWTQVTAIDAAAHCAAAGHRLCTEAEWEEVCMAGSSCAFGYQSSCDDYAPNTCNGNDYDPIAGAPDDDIVLPTNSLTSCFADTGAGGRVFDISGNVWEWTQPRSAGTNPMRGGSNNNPQDALRCDFDFVVASDTFQFTNVGFRCCADSAP